PNFRDYAVEVSSPGAVMAESTRVMGRFLRDAMKLNMEQRNFRLFSPDENNSNRWQEARPQRRPDLRHQDDGRSGGPATFAFRTYAFAMLAGTLVTIASFVPVGFAASDAGEYTFSLFAVVSIALIVSWFVAVVFAPLLGVAILKPPTTTQAATPGRVFRGFRR